MFAGTVHSVKRFLVENHLQVMFFRNLLHQNHQHHILVNCLCRLTEDRGTLELVWRNLVVAGLQENAEFVGLSLKILHKRADAGRDCSEIMVLQLLVLCRSVSDDRPVAEHEVRTGIVEGLVNEEVLLFDSKVHLHRLHASVKKTCH